MKRNVVIQHSRKGHEESTSDVILDGTLKLRTHSYISNWEVSDCHYDVFLEMPWHVANTPRVDYLKKVVNFQDGEISYKPGLNSMRKPLHGTHLSVKEFEKVSKSIRKL